MRRVGETQLRDLAGSWARHRLAIAAPERFPSWDWVILTAASEAQADWYAMALEAARQRGVLAGATRTLVVPDPGGRRIGSGGATFNALRAAAAEDPELATRRVLLIHSGGDSRRVPWANTFGKAFIPLPLLADPDHALPTVFDHLVAVSSGFVEALNGGGMVTLSGDMLLLFDPVRLRLPCDAAVVVTTPVPLDLASRHGVVVGGPDGRVRRLLQKASPAELEAAGALIEGGAALLDTGVWAFTGAAFGALVRASLERPGAYDLLLQSGSACSLYEELAGAMVAASQPAVAATDWGRRLVEHLGALALEHRRADELVFLHFGTTAEILDHFSGTWSGALLTRVLADDGPRISPDARLYVSTVHSDAQVGWGSLVYGCRLGPHAAIGRRCVAVGVDDGGEAWTLPDHTAVWQVPLKPEGGGARVVTVVCGTDDHPGAEAAHATYCNRDLRWWLEEHEVRPEELWPAGTPAQIWTARLFPVEEMPASLRFAMWLAGSGRGRVAERIRRDWRAAERISLAELHRRADYRAWSRQLAATEATLLLQTLGRAVESALDRNVHELARRLPTVGLRTRALSLADQMLADDAPVAPLAPRSRRLQMRADLALAGGSLEEARRAAEEAFAAVQAEVAEAVRYTDPEPVRGCPPRRLEIRLPVRFDISGGWSDTPPYCLERPAMVLNFALRLDGERPVAVEAETLPVPRWELEVEDLGARRVVESPVEALASDGVADPFHLLKTALRVAGYAGPDGITQGVRLRTRAAVPKGSGLGTSSILGAAVMRVLQELAGRPADTRTVSDLVLVLEQRMHTGGGWQDQIGGLVGGVKCIRTLPRRPLRLEIERVPLRPSVREEFERRFVLVFTGQQRLARNILQLVVQRYLRRESRTLDAIRALVDIAAEARAALAMGRLDDLGAALAGAWAALQQLTPECSNPHIDALFREVEDLCVGGKLAGAGGGGFLGVLAKDPEAALRVRERLTALDPALRVYSWSLDDE
ncbi:MAG: hypothetical protein N2652_02310 [Kiritimatiellae bacterium]|nr:hypothetical protein [Kiritimatiellia bacterium]